MIHMPSRKIWRSYLSNRTCIIYCSNTQYTYDDDFGTLSRIPGLFYFISLQKNKFRSILFLSDRDRQNYRERERARGWRVEGVGGWVGRGMWIGVMVGQGWELGVFWCRWKVTCRRSPVNYPHKGQWRGALMFSLMCARINGWVNNGEVSYLRRHRAHYDVIVMNKD